MFLGDGINEIVVGNPWSDQGSFSNSGGWWMLFMNSDATVQSTTVVSYGNRNGFTSEWGSSDHHLSYKGIDSIGDLNLDGVEDIVISWSHNDDGGSGDCNRGAVEVAFLNSDGTVLSHQRISGTKGGYTGSMSDHDHWGHAVGGLPDFDGDDIPELIAQMPHADDGCSDSCGGFTVIFLNRDGTSRSHQRVSNTHGGWTMESMPDSVYAQHT
jgi:hypothetical protein